VQEGPVVGGAIGEARL